MDRNPETDVGGQKKEIGFCIHMLIPMCSVKDHSFLRTESINFVSLFIQ
jgi:hypothetical protein